MPMHRAPPTAALIKRKTCCISLWEHETPIRVGHEIHTIEEGWLRSLSTRYESVATVQQQDGTPLVRSTITDRLDVAFPPPAAAKTTLPLPPTRIMLGSLHTGHEPMTKPFSGHRGIQKPDGST